MKKLAETIAENAYFTIFIGILTIMGFIIALVPYIQEMNGTVQLSFTQATTPIISDRISTPEGLDISVQGRKVGRMTVTTCFISNSGKVIIEDSDVYGDGFRIFTEDDDAEVLFANVVSQSYDTNNCRLSYDGNSVNVHFDVLEKKEQVAFNVYHTGDVDTVFSIEGRVKGGKIKEYEIIDSSDRPKLLRISIFMLVAALVFSLLSYFTSGPRVRWAINSISCILLLMAITLLLCVYQV